MGRVLQILAEGGVEAAEREAQWIVLSAAGLDRADLFDTMPTIVDQQVATAESLAHRRVAGEPLQYLTGVAGFRHLDLAVGPGVLIPRPETEVVAERAMARLPGGGIAVDCGTGSGAIALAIADERPDARVFATERSTSALAWAERNRTRFDLDVELIACDLLAGLPDGLRGAVDVIVSNPPYVATTERDLLPRDVVEHEPHEALFAGEHGLNVIRRLVDEVPRWARRDGWIVLESGDRQAEQVSELLRERGFAEVAAHPDLAGRMRVVEGRFAP